MAKHKKVDGNLPPWLNSKILSAVDHVWKVREDDNIRSEECKRRIKHLTKTYDTKEMSWVLMLLTIPKIIKILMDSDFGREFTAMKQAERILH